MRLLSIVLVTLLISAPAHADRQTRGQAKLVTGALALATSCIFSVVQTAGVGVWATGYRGNDGDAEAVGFSMAMFSMAWIGVFGGMGMGLVISSDRDLTPPAQLTLRF